MNNFKKIHIFNRHYSRNKKHPQRHPDFNYEKTFGNLLATTDFNLCNLNVLFEHKDDYDNYFIKKYEGIKPFTTHFIDTSRDKWIGRTKEDMGWARSIAAAAEVIRSQNLPETDLIYITDDDFIHVPYWGEICLDFINNVLKGANWWVCPCDYGDKYWFQDENHTIDQYGTDLGMYADLKTRVILSNYRYWREMPNCLTSSIIPVKTFNRDYEEYWSKGYSDCSLNNEISKKHATKFYTPQTSLSCHAIIPFYPPFIDWHEIMNNIRVKL